MILICVQGYEVEDSRINHLIKACEECKIIFNNKHLDIEFSFCGDKLYILQVRAIVQKGKLNLSNIDIKKNIKKIYNKIDKLNDFTPIY